MSHLSYTYNARQNLGEIAEFWRDVPEVGTRAIKEIKLYAKKLKPLPLLGKPCPDDNGASRLLTVRFGSSGYVIRYRYDQPKDTVFVLAIKKFRQANFNEN